MARKIFGIQYPSQGNPELRFVMPSEMYAGDQVRSELIVLEAGTENPYRGTLAPATLTASGDVTFDRRQVRLAEDVGHFYFKPIAPCELTITAKSGDVMATHMITVKPSVPRPVVFWDFSTPPVTDKEAFSSDFELSEDLTQRANRAVARIDMSVSPKVVTDRSHIEILKIFNLPGEDKLNKSNIRGVIVDLMTSPDFMCDDPNARVTAVMQSPANWWMKLSSVPLKDIKEWKTYNFDVTNQEYFKAMPSAFNLIFILEANKPVKMNGALYFDRIGFMVR